MSRCKIHEQQIMMRCRFVPHVQPDGKSEYCTSFYTMAPCLAVLCIHATPKNASSFYTQRVSRLRFNHRSIINLNDNEQVTLMSNSEAIFLVAMKRLKLAK
jgi:hypothetical protein